MSNLSTIDILERMFHFGVTTGMKSSPWLCPPVSHELHGPAAEAGADF